MTKNSLTLQGHLVIETGVLPNHRLVIEDGKIRAMEPLSLPAEAAMNLPYILPGFRDQHIHDLVGQQMAATESRDASVSRFDQTLRDLGRRGVTGVSIATFGDRLENLKRYGEAARTWMIHADNGRTGARLLGLHIEGTFLNLECRGAQPAEFILVPTRDDCFGALDRLYATGAVRMVNIVPDYGEASLRLMKHARQKGLLLGSGHLKPPADLLRRAYEECGLQYMVHYTNGPTGQSFKPFGGGGAFEGGLHLPVAKELIVDLVHIDPRYVLDILRRTEQRWGPEKIITVADAIFPTPDQIPEGEFRIGSTVARLGEDGRCLLTVAYAQPDGSLVPAPPNTLCGSVLTMDRAFCNWLDLLTQPVEGHWFDHPALPLEEALVKAARLCSTNQAILDGSYESTGRIAVGKAADLVVGRIEKTGGNHALDIRQVFQEGHCIHSI